MNNESKSAKVISIAGVGNTSSVSLVRLPAAVHRVREKAVQLFQQTLKNLFAGADDALFNLADNARSNQDQNIYFEAMREVRLKRRDVEKNYFLALDEAYAALLKPTAGDAENYGGDFSLDDLSLVENDKLEFQVAVESMIAKALKNAAEPAQHIALRFDSLVPAKVYQQNNPLGPEVLCRRFWDVIEPLDIDIKAKLILLKLFDKAVVSQLLKIYTVINNVFIQQNILPSLVVKPNVTSADTAKKSPAETDNPTGTNGSSSSESKLLIQLRQLLNSGMPGSEVSHSGHSGGEVLKADQLTQALTSLQQVAQPETGQGQLLLDSSQILKLIQQQGQTQVRLSPIDNDVIRLMNMLFGFILDDRNLAPSMKALISRLQIPMLKIAVENKAFFNVAGHPARRLLNELATAALGWEEPDQHSPKDPLYKKICSVVDAILQGFERDISIFDGLLTDFIAFTEKEQRRAVILERRTLDAEDGKAKSDQARQRVSEQLESSTAGQTIPDCVAAILRGPWHNVLFLQLLKYGEASEEWLSSCKTVDDLVWSVTAIMDAEARPRLMALLPDLLKRLKAGFEIIAFNPFEANELLQQLEREHLLRLRQTDAPEFTPEPQELDAEQIPVLTEKVGEPDLSESANVDDTDTDKATAEPEVSAAWLEQVNRFSQGAWFEVAEEGKPVYRCRLAAIIPGVDKFIFVNRNGMKVVEKNRTELAQALEKGQFQLLDDSMLFDRALESVIGNLRAARARRD